MVPSPVQGTPWCNHGVVPALETEPRLIFAPKALFGDMEDIHVQFFVPECIVWHIKLALKEQPHAVAHIIAACRWYSELRFHFFDALSTQHAYFATFTVPGEMLWEAFELQQKEISQFAK